MERLCKCYDGDCWYVLKGNKGKRTGVPSARVSFLAFTTPKQFLETVCPKMLSAENGLAERVLLFYHNKEEKDSEKYSLSASAREAFLRFAKPQDKLPSTQGASVEGRKGSQLQQF
ncbi:hypothetical protein pdam_00021360 [Pocillopora damicornis]|uniref:Uncharacterized protein n=1 Tax=Pocillopora damicornis TaxID=46731 RepID=A0A3M6UNP6_POCDA|nr:hypothetical protein pdam_00021360 [Pocillopora damicornis]